MPLTARQILDNLVSFPTVSRDSNLDLADWVEEFLRNSDIEPHRMLNEDGTKAAIFASIGPEAPGGVVLSGHTDVVPVDGQEWSTDPWQVVERDGKLFGRGTCDMKGFDAIALAGIAKARAADLKRPLQIALSYDEEIGCTGAPPLIQAMQGVVPKADIAIIGEPSMMKVVTGHKGGAGFHVKMRGFEVHSSIMHTGVNAIMEGAKLIDWANQMNERNRAETPTPLAAIFEPPWTTLHTGMISGGTAHNITARDCEFGVDFRFVPGDDPEDWKARFLEKVAQIQTGMQSIVPGSGIDVAPYFGVPGLKPEDDGAAETLTRHLTGDNGTHVVSYGTEAGHFQAGEYSAVVCGPGDIAQAHQEDEFITIEQFEAGEAFIDRLIAALCR